MVSMTRDFSKASVLMRPTNARSFGSAAFWANNVAPKANPNRIRFIEKLSHFTRGGPPERGWLAERISQRHNRKPFQEADSFLRSWLLVQQLCGERLDAVRERRGTASILDGFRDVGVVAWKGGEDGQSN